MNQMSPVENVARASYGKLLAILTKAAAGDIQLAEDCLSAAFVKALETWDSSSVPKNPEAWLIRTAKNTIIDNFRRSQIQKTHEPLISELIDERAEKTSIFDHRLEMLFVCAHPAIDPQIRVPLMLQTVLGFQPDQLSSLFLASPSALEKRLTRAKQKIKLSKIPFEVPEESGLVTRIEYVTDAIYGLFGRSWESFNSEYEEEALYLAELTHELLPTQAEVKGLLSLMYFLKSRHHARRQNGTFVPFKSQTVDLWDRALIEKAEKVLLEAYEVGEIGRFQLEAAIQSALIHEKVSGRSVAHELKKLYSALVSLHPTVGICVSYSAFLIENEEFAEADKILGEIDRTLATSYQPYWVTKSELAKRLNDPNFEKYLQIAIGLTQDTAVRNYLLNQRPG